jgi:L-ascorbate metabolism protein UlaG (beta-lactamase superfamily)
MVSMGCVWGKVSVVHEGTVHTVATTYVGIHHQSGVGVVWVSYRFEGFVATVSTWHSIAPARQQREKVDR